MEQYNNKVYYGEDRQNLKREEISVFELDKTDYLFKQIWKFKQIRHVHGIFHDPYTNSFWITTGDSDSESAIWETTDAISLTSIG